MERRYCGWMATLMPGITLACLLLSGPTAGNTNTASDWGHFSVGFGELDLSLSGSRGEARPLHLMIWYPADVTAYRSARRTGRQI